MSKYFNKTKLTSWTLLDAYNSFTEKLTEKSTQQKLDSFHAHLTHHKDPNVQSLLKNWKSFYKQAIAADDKNNYASKNPEKNACNIFNTTNDFANSSNATVNVGPVNNRDKRKPESELEFEAQPYQKRRNRGAMLEEKGTSEEEQNEGDEDDEEEDDEEEEEEGPRSDLSNDYHPNRVVNYILEEEDHWSAAGSQEAVKDAWVVEDFNITVVLKDFKLASSKISPKKLSDMRLLEKATRVINHIKDDLELNKEAIPDNTNVVGWANQLAQAALGSRDWFEIQDVTIQFLQKAQENKDKYEMITANVMHRLALTMTGNRLKNDVEDTYAHNIISALFDPIFRSDPILSSQWANGFLRGSTQYKPDFLVFLQHSKDRYDLGVSEIKPPSNSSSNNNGESDTVKIGKEMAWMLNTLVREGVEDPVVCGILIKGLTMTTYKLDLSHHQIYRLIELSSITLFENLQGISVLPTIVRNIMQVKNIAKKTALKAKKRALAKSNGKPISHSPPLSYIANSSYNLRKQAKK